jgi:hypothetical protein
LKQSTITNHVFHTTSFVRAESGRSASHHPKKLHPGSHWFAAQVAYSTFKFSTMSAGGAMPLKVPFTGFVRDSMDGLVLFEACLSGELPYTSRRPKNHERSQLTKSGNIFIHKENASGIKRWTDGVVWSPSPISGNFLIYRELDKPFPPGKKHAIKQKRSSLSEVYGSQRSNSDSKENVEMLRPISPSEHLSTRGPTNLACQALSRTKSSSAP